MKRDRIKYERSYSLGWRDARDGLTCDHARMNRVETRPYPVPTMSQASNRSDYDKGWNAYHAHRARNEAAGKETG